MKSYIETFFPTDLLNAQVTREKGGNPFKGVHRWYSRKPLSFSRGCILGAILPDTLTEVEFLKLLGMKTSEAETYWNDRDSFIKQHKNYTRLFDRTPDGEMKKKVKELIKKHWGKNNLTLLDPFSGGGSIPFEALRYDLNVIANDLNPVAVSTMKAAIEFPFIFGKELQQDINHYVEWIGKEAKIRLAEFFPSPYGEEVQNYLWAHTVPCEYCEMIVPLSPNWWLTSETKYQGAGKSREPKSFWYAVKPIPNPETKTVEFELIKGKAGNGKNIVMENGDVFDPEQYNTISHGVGTCPNCKRIISEEYIKKIANEKGMGHQMYAVAYKKLKANGAAEEGLNFRLPDPTFEPINISSPNSPSPARGEGWGEVGVKEDKACPERSRRGEGESKLAVVGYNLGKLIYLLDSIFDYSQDIKFNKFNPLSACYPETNGSKYFNQLPPSVINELKQLSSEALAEIKNNLDNIETLMLYNNPKNDENNPPLPPFNKGGMGGFSWEILENILVSGLSSKFTDIFGMFHNKCHYEKRSDEVIPKIQIASHPLAMTYETCHIFANKDMKKQTLFKPAMLEIPLLTSCFSLIPQKAYAANGNVTNICCNYIISIGLLLFIFYFVFTKFFGVRRCCCCSNDKEHNCFQINCCNC